MVIGVSVAAMFGFQELIQTDCPMFAHPAKARIGIFHEKRREQNDYKL